MCDPELGERARGSEAMIFVHDVERLYAEHQSHGAPIVSALEDKPWDLRE